MSRMINGQLLNAGITPFVVAVCIARPIRNDSHRHTQRVQVEREAKGRYCLVGRQPMLRVGGVAFFVCWQY
ncbi:hypothetical protein C8Q77DRAFT_1146967 [Trametes polyzona]|nr:hypothetical protein C8Q77DRAFT_1146967 [Trametes polyzona]